MAVTWITGEDTRDPGSPHADAAAEAASWVLYKLTGEKYGGIRTTTEWYGLESSLCFSCEAVGLYDAYPEDNNFSVSHHHYAIPDSPRGIRLRGRPVLEVTTVVMDGEPIDPTSYKLYNNAVLVRADNECWNMTRGFDVTYKFGNNPPELGRIAAMKLADELLMSVTGDEDCALPERVTSVTRQGISYTILDPQTFIENGRTGIYEVDLFIKTANPDRAKKRPKIFSPDLPRGRRYN